jgi:hypothetical protein
MALKINAERIALSELPKRKTFKHAFEEWQRRIMQAKSQSI